MNFHLNLRCFQPRRSTSALFAEASAQTFKPAATLCLLASCALLSPLARAQNFTGTLGGPLSRPNAGSHLAAPSASTPDEATGTRLAQSGGEPSAPPTEGADTSSTVTEAPLPFDLANVRRVKVAGEPVGQDPIRIGNLDLMVPIVPNFQSNWLTRLGASVSRAATQNLPGNLNTPTEDQVFQINLSQGKPIMLTIGKRTAYIDNIERQLRAAPLVWKDRIWLPVFSIAPLMGAAIRLEPDGTLHINPTVQSVELFTVKNMVALTIKTSAPLKERAVLMGTLDDPPKLYLDFPGYSMGFDAANTAGERTVSAGLGDVQRVRAGLFQGFPDTTRVVLDLKREMNGVAQPLPDPTLFAMILVPPGGRPRVAQPQMLNPDAGDDGILGGLTIVVDAGHGGDDNGAGGARSWEKNHNLDISRRLSRNLMAHRANVLMTRNDDRFISLQGRVDFANSQKADMFVSVHINSFLKSSKGTQTHFWTAQSAALAREVQKELVKATGLKNRGLIQNRLFVTRRTLMPSILTESAFISNPAEEALMLDPEWRERVARGITQGIINYVRRYVRPSTTSG